MLYLGYYTCFNFFLRDNARAGPNKDEAWYRTVATVRINDELQLEGCPWMQQSFKRWDFVLQKRIIYISLRLEKKKNNMQARSVTTWSNYECRAQWAMSVAKFICRSNESPCAAFLTRNLALGVIIVDIQLSTDIMFAY